MSTAIEIVLKSDFRDLIQVYIATFAHSYARLNSGPADFDQDLAIYDSLINSKSDDIIRAAAFSITGYSHLYKVLPRETFDEFKIIYYLGLAIERHLTKAGHAKIVQVHMFTLIGLMDEALRRKGVVKPQLTGAMTQLIRFGYFDRELGNTGCYLIYKCSSTAPKHQDAA